MFHSVRKNAGYVHLFLEVYYEKNSYSINKQSNCRHRNNDMQTLQFIFLQLPWLQAVQHLQLMLLQ